VVLAARRPADRAGAETAFKRSLHEARRRRALGWELRTALSYAEHLRDWGREAEADRLLRQVTAKFAAGEVSAELREARRQVQRPGRARPSLSLAPSALA
jgi:hypothetical protein